MSDHRIPKHIMMQQARLRRKRAAVMRLMGYTWRDIGTQLGVSTERARQIAKRGILEAVALLLDKC